jgi:hypothetical protein
MPPDEPAAIATASAAGLGGPPPPAGPGPVPPAVPTPPAPAPGGAPTRTDAGAAEPAPPPQAAPPAAGSPPPPAPDAGASSPPAVAEVQAASPGAGAAAPPPAATPAGEPTQAPAGGPGVTLNQVGDTDNQYVINKMRDIYMAPPGRSPADPTDELPDQLLDIGPFTSHIEEQLLSALETHRVALLSSFDHETGLAAAYALIRHERFVAYGKRTLVLTRTDNKVRTDLSIDLFTRPEYFEKRQEKEIVLVEVSPEGRAFLDSLMRVNSEPLHAGTIKDSLRSRQVLILVAAKCDLLPLGPDQRLQPFAFAHWPVPFLLPLLQRHFPDQRARELEQELRRQVDGGLWGALAEMYLEVSAQLQSDPAQFEEALRASKRGEPSRLRVHTHEATPLAKLAGEKELHRTVLYTAVYFPDLTPQEFDWMICLLLADRTVEVKEESQVVADNGEIRTRVERVERRLVEIWRAAPDTILADCRLGTSTWRDGTQTIQFTAPHLRRELRAALETRFPIFLTATFAHLQNAGLLFSPGASAAIAENIIRLSVERTLVDPGYFGTRWLVDFVASLRRQGSTESDTDDPSEMLVELFAELRDELLRRHYCGRLAQLIREMLRHDRLRATVRGFFGALVGERRHEVAPDILLELVRRLRFAPYFDGFHWLRRLLDESPSEVAERAYLCLLDLAADSGARIFEVIDAVRAWLPASAERRERIPPSGRYALRFIVDYSHFSLSSVPADAYGAWPSRCALLAAFPRDREAMCARVEMLAGWLLDPGVPEAMGPEDAVTPDLYLEFLGDLIEELLLVLEGTDPATAHAEARLLADGLVSAFSQRLGRPRRGRLARYWQGKRGAYRRQAVATPLEPAGRAKERRRLLARWQNLNLLSRRLDAAATRLATARTEIGP